MSTKGRDERKTQEKAMRIAVRWGEAPDQCYNAGAGEREGVHADTKCLLIVLQCFPVLF